MQEVEIIVVEDNGTILGSLDLSRPTDFPLSLTKSIASIKDISKRKTYYSLDFNIPNTQNNNVLLMGVKQINATVDTKSILNKKRCYIKVNGNLWERGFVRFSLSTFNGDYKGTFYGGNADWVELLTEVDLNELDWSNLGEPAAGVEEYNGTRFNTINNGDSVDYDICYPYLDRNTGSSGSQFRPVLYMKKVLERMFEKIGYTINSNFLDSDFVKGDGGEFKGLVIDPAFTMTIDQNIIDQTAAKAGTTQINLALPASAWDTNYMIGNIATYPTVINKNTSKFPNLFDNTIQDNSFLFNAATSEYTANVSGDYSLSLDLPTYQYAMFDTQPAVYDWVSVFGTPSLGTEPPFVEVIVVKNNVSNTVIDGTILGQTTYSGAFTNSFTVDSLLIAGDTVSIWFNMVSTAAGWGFLYPANAYLDATNPFSLDFWRFRPREKTVVEFKRKNTVGLGDSFNINSHLPANVSCLDVLQDLKVLHNLYFVADPQRQEITIEPRDDFYQDISQAEDITDTIDLETEPTVDYSSKYKRNLVFRYKNDNKDGYLKKWETINLRTYGEYRHALSNRFEKGDTVFKLKHIAATGQEELSATGGGIITSRLWKNYDPIKNANLGINEEYAMRYFQVIRSQQIDDNGQPRRTASPFIVSSAVMESYANLKTINSAQLTFNGANGLFARHYAKTATNIEQLALLKIKRLMTLDQFRNLDFSRPVYISAPAEIQGYYIYESVDNFDGIEEKPVRCKLLKWRNWTGATVNTNQATNINVITQTPQGAINQPIKFIYNSNNPNVPTSIVDVADTDINNSIKPLYYI